MSFSNETRTPGSVVCFQRGGNRQLFCVHVATGSAYCYKNLLAGLGSACTVHGIYAPGFGLDWKAMSCIEEMATLYVEQIKMLQPTGPYWLCGYSMGGMVALEMAKLLVQSGNLVKPVIVVDARYPSEEERSSCEFTDQEPDYIWRFFIGAYFDWDWSEKLLETKEFTKLGRSGRLWYLATEGRKMNIGRMWDVDKLATILSFQDTMLRTHFEYRPGVCPVDVGFFYANEESDHSYVARVLSLVGGRSKLISCAGRHISMFFDNENVLQLGRKIGSFMETS
ncbi:alpha/beta fold hydrolase [Bradyrhizobium sp. SZCCHNR2035]|uniref:thioesterase domain-containing protein n=1 Tax=Bradyrhizobium sp. SZCCHNR2035 TaxID=3057386 RepID=UPI002916F24F|nr:alpha/beta fold hydrolase [Bradyrhizobium sp. SZCCHNR2035]